MNHSTPGLPVHHQLPEFTQIHVHGAGDAIQPSDFIEIFIVKFFGHTKEYICIYAHN